MSSPDARVRAPLTKAIVELLRKQPAAVRSNVRTSAGAAIAHVEAASRVDWIPLGVQLEILAALQAEVGPEGYDVFCTAHFGSTVEQPLIKSVFEGTLRVFGVSPGSLYRMFPKSWAMMSSGCGVVSVEGDVSGGRAVLTVSELPIEEPNIDLFVRGFRATFSGPIEILGRRGDVAMSSFLREARTARYVATWS